MKKYLDNSDIIDWQHPAVLSQAAEITGDLKGDEAIAEACFLFVRDQITHSWDSQQNPVTCKASAVLEYGTGYCYAKSHLLVALLRANAIAAGLCYQRLTIDHDRPPFCLHGLVAVYLEQYGWYRIDPRGNKPGVDAAFCPPQEKLAYTTDLDGEADLPEIWLEPLALVVDALQAGNDYLDVAQNLPDIAVVKI
ncbi:Cro/Cl family transcriptional regulator [Gammaproteobacteria bacterium 53_120_T64]|nr:Cro/Cl family transcriptional regulator [Gammaproteobacteria bacterium 53_120_T64]